MFSEHSHADICMIFTLIFSFMFGEWKLFVLLRHHLQVQFVQWRHSPFILWTVCPPSYLKSTGTCVILLLTHHVLSLHTSLAFFQLEASLSYPVLRNLVHTYTHRVLGFLFFRRLPSVQLSTRWLLKHVEDLLIRLYFFFCKEKIIKNVYC